VGVFFAGGVVGVLLYRQFRLPSPYVPAAPSALPRRGSIPNEKLGQLSIFLLAGQSNMSGRGVMENPPPAALPDVFVYGNDGHWHEGKEPVDFAEGQIDLVSADPGAGFGPSIAFAEALLARRPGTPIGLVPCAKGGSALAEWTPSRSPQSLYGSCLSRALAASALGTVKGILFFQGEADAVDPIHGIGIPLYAESWAKEFSVFVAAFRRDLASPVLPVVFAELGKNPNLAAFNRWELVKAQQRSVSLPAVGMIHTDDLELGDALHFTTESYRIIGQRFASVMDTLLPPP